MDPCEQAVAMIKSRDFREWRGIPPECTVNDLFPTDLAVEESDPWFLDGNESHLFRFRIVRLDGYFKFWVNHGEKYDRLDGWSPKLATSLDELVAALGKPAARLDAYWIIALIERYEWVWPERGISLFFSDDSRAPDYIYLFKPTTLNEYKAYLKKTGKARLFPLPYMETPPELIEEFDRYEREHAVQ